MYSSVAQLLVLLILVSSTYAHDHGRKVGACGNSTVEITWLGVTMYFVRFKFHGKEVKILLDDQINGNFVDPAFVDVLGIGGKLDYIFLGHMHFDHTGECWPFYEPSDFKCAPFQQQAARFSAKVVAPLYGCQLVQNGTECTPVLPTPTGAQVLDLKDIGLQVTAVPNAHAHLPVVKHHGERGPPGCSGGLTRLDCPDGFAYLFKFPGEDDDSTCDSTFFWADTAHNQSPYLVGYSEVGDPNLGPLNYSRLLRDVFDSRAGNQRTTLMAFPSFFMPDEATWQEWATIVRPRFHTNHHHGGTLDFWPKLASKLEGSALGSPEATWLPSAEVPPDQARGLPSYVPVFLPLNDFFNTMLLNGPSSIAKVDLGYATKFRKLAAMQKSIWV